MLSSNIKNDINDCKNVSKQNIDDKNIIQTTAFYIKKSPKCEEPWEINENLTLESSVIHHSIDIKEEDIKLEPESDTFSDEQNSIKEHSPSGMVEFVGMQDVKIEEDEYDEEEDPIKVNAGTFNCNYCKKAFTSDEYCQKHTKRCRERVYNPPSTSATAVPDKKPRLSNDKEKQYQCDECDNKFKSQKRLYQHLRRHKLYNCTECHKQFTTPSLLAIHVLIHTGEKPHKCTQCDAAFNTAGNLKTHMLTHTGARPHKCSQCGQSFAQSGHLTRHMRVHTGERPYQCTQCSKAFTTSGHLTTHMRVHTDEKPHQCSVCSQTFSQSSSLKKHIRTHTGEKPHKCSVCSQAFAQSSPLKRHMKTHSNKTNNKT